MTNDHNPETLAAAAREVLATCYDDTDRRYVAEVHLELELIEGGLMKPDECIELMDRWCHPGYLSVIIDRELIPHIVINAETGSVTYDQTED